MRLPWVWSHSRRWTPAVRWLHERVAPLMFLMSSPKRKGGSIRRPANCLRQLGVRAEDLLFFAAGVTGALLQ